MCDRMAEVTQFISVQTERFSNKNTCFIVLYWIILRIISNYLPTLTTLVFKDRFIKLKPRQLTLTATRQRALRWRMLPIHASILFNGPVEVVQALIVT